LNSFLLSEAITEGDVGAVHPRHHDPEFCKKMNDDPSQVKQALFIYSYCPAPQESLGQTGFESTMRERSGDHNRVRRKLLFGSFGGAVRRLERIRK